MPRVRAHSLQPLSAHFILLVITGFIALLGATFPLRAQTETPLPTIGPIRYTEAPKHAIPDGTGTLNYEGDFLLAGDYAIERDPYDTTLGRVSPTFRIRRQSDSTLLGTLDASTGLNAPAAYQPFSDGQLLAFAVRPTSGDDRGNRVEVRSLPGGELKFTLALPSARRGDDFGRAVWFTSNRILVAAPGRDRYQTNDGAICVFDRTSGRLIKTLSPGIKGARFSTAPTGQPLQVPYLQVSGSRALIVHNRRAFLLTKDNLHTLVIPPTDGHTVTLRDARYIDDRIVLTTREFRRGQLRAGRVIAFDSEGRRTYQLRAVSFEGSYDFPSRISGAANRLYVHDAVAGYKGTEFYGILHTVDLKTGRKLATHKFPRNSTVTQNGDSLTLSGGLLWLLHYTQLEPSRVQTSWLGYDPLTFELRATLLPPGTEWFLPTAPQALGSTRFAVAATWPDGSVFSFGMTAAGGLIYDTETQTCESRIRVSSSTSDDQGGFARQLLFTPGATADQLRVRLNQDVVREWFDFAIVRPVVTPEVTLQGRLTYTTASGYRYDLLRQTPGTADYALVRSLTLDNGLAHADTVPYADYLAATPYRLDGAQFSRRITQATPLPAALADVAATSLSVSDTRLALSSRDIFTASPGLVRVVDRASGDLQFTLESPETSRASRFGQQVKINAHYVAVGSPYAEYAGNIDVFDAATGALVRSFSTGRGLGTHFALSGHRLAATWIDSTYQSGQYTRAARVTVFELPSGRILHTTPFATESSAYTVSFLPLETEVSGDFLVVRAAGPSGSFADEGRVRILDLETGALRYELASAAPAAGEAFGSWLATGGDWLAVGSSGTWKVGVYDLPTGTLSHTLTMDDPAAVRINYASVTPKLSIDSALGYLSWFVTQDTEAGPLGLAGAAYLYDLTTGTQVAKAVPSYTGYTSPRLQGALLADGTLYGFTSQRPLAAFPYADIVAAPLLSTSETLTPSAAARLEFPTLNGIVYQPELSVDDGATWTTTGKSLLGNSAPASVTLPLPTNTAPETIQFRIKTRWAMPYDYLSFDPFP